jgi:hypothetical protein
MTDDGLRTAVPGVPGWLGYIILFTAGPCILGQQKENFHTEIHL